VCLRKLDPKIRVPPRGDGARLASWQPTTLTLQAHRLGLIAMAAGGSFLATAGAGGGVRVAPEGVLRALAAEAGVRLPGSFTGGGGDGRGGAAAGGRKSGVDDVAAASVVAEALAELLLSARGSSYAGDGQQQQQQQQQQQAAAAAALLSRASIGGGAGGGDCVGEGLAAERLRLMVSELLQRQGAPAAAAAAVEAALTGSGGKPGTDGRRPGAAGVGAVGRQRAGRGSAGAVGSGGSDSKPRDGSQHERSSPALSASAPPAASGLGGGAAAAAPAAGSPVDGVAPGWPRRHRVTPGDVDDSPWLLDYDDIRLGRVMGEGAYGHVRLGWWRETEVAVK
ncbi:hypothetical protein MNEG_15271, partial [Monoraphidium neglectum]